MAARVEATPIRRGLTLGKYAPLHKGHQLVVETAIVETDVVTVVVYDAPEATDVPLPVRARWVRELYPQVRVIEARGGPAEVGDSPALMRAHEDFLLRGLGLAGITHFFSSEFYGAHVSRALGARDRRVDPGRLRVPVSASMIRQDPWAHRAFVHPRVYRDLVANVAILGAPSTGKTTLAERLASEHGTRWMPEYGREYWERHQSGRRLTPAQLVELAEGHRAREEALLGQANRVLFTDTNALTTYVFAHHYHGGADARLAAMADACPERYDLTLLCDTDIPYEDTPDRSGAGNREALQAMLREELAARGIPHVTLRGDLETRVRHASALLSRHRRHTPAVAPREPAGAAVP